VTRVAGIERAIALGKALLELRSQAITNAEFGMLRRQSFPDVDAQTVSALMLVARAFGDKPKIYQRLSWQAICELASPSPSPARRRAFELLVQARENITGPQIKRACGRLPTGRPRQERAAARMAAKIQSKAPR
jgi:hypothetical protein